MRRFRQIHDRDLYSNFMSDRLSCDERWGLGCQSFSLGGLDQLTRTGGLDGADGVGVEIKPFFEDRVFVDRVVDGLDN